MNALILWIAQGFGVGRIPVAPGTFGSLVGLGWCALLLLPGSLALFFAGTLLGLAASVWLCGSAEEILKQTDPGSVVWDEIAAIPVCFVSWVLLRQSQTGEMAGVNYFFSGNQLWLALGLFGAFRLFDVWKPWPVRQSQRLPGGWGVTVDDFLAAVYVNGCVWLAHLAGVF